MRKKDIPIMEVSIGLHERPKEEVYGYYYTYTHTRINGTHMHTRSTDLQDVLSLLFRELNRDLSFYGDNE